MTKEPSANPVGRPTKYRPDYHPAWAEKLAKLGATDEDIADALDICVATLYNWRNEHPEFLEALKGGKIMADAEVASKLFHRATGGVKAFIAEIDSKNNDLESDGHKSASVKLLSKKEGADLIRAITLASFHGADVLMAAYKQNHCSLNFSVV